MLSTIMNSNAIQDENDVLQQVSTETLSSWFFSQNLPEELDTVPTTVENTHLGNYKHFLCKACLWINTFLQIPLI